jgi:hypothetical protein
MYLGKEMPIRLRFVLGIEQKTNQSREGSGPQSRDKRCPFRERLMSYGLDTFEEIGVYFLSRNKAVEAKILGTLP